MTLCAALSLSSCAAPRVTDSFCDVYEPVVVSKGDGTITATVMVKRRILGNEQTYRGLCPGTKAR